jgi:hypothetical protein
MAAVTMRIKLIDRAVSKQRETERNASAQSEAEEVIREIGITVVIFLGLAVLANLVISGG